jgi:hypothetical protein
MCETIVIKGHGSQNSKKGHESQKGTNRGKIQKCMKEVVVEPTLDSTCKSNYEMYTKKLQQPNWAYKEVIALVIAK